PRRDRGEERPRHREREGEPGDRGGPPATRRDSVGPGGAGGADVAGRGGPEDGPREGAAGDERARPRGAPRPHRAGVRERAARPPGSRVPGAGTSPEELGLDLRPRPGPPGGRPPDRRGRRYRLDGVALARGAVRRHEVRLPGRHAGPDLEREADGGPPVHGARPGAEEGRPIRRVAIARAGIPRWRTACDPAGSPTSP